MSGRSTRRWPDDRLGRGALWSLALLAAASCQIGGNRNPADSPVATSPHGATIHVDWRESDEGYWGDEAELLAVTDSGLYLLDGGSVVLYPFGVDAVVQAQSAPGTQPFNLDDPPDVALSVLEPYARYPFGLDRERMDGLLAALGRDSVVVRRVP